MEFSGNITSIEALDSLISQSEGKYVAIFKHSTRCPISSMILNRIYREWNISPGVCEIYYLDLIAYRPVSDAIAEKLKVKHESPQIVIIKNRECVYHVSHHAIQPHEIEEFLSAH